MYSSMDNFILACKIIALSSGSQTLEHKDPLLKLGAHLTLED